MNEIKRGKIAIIGCGYGKEFDISKCKFDKVIIFADADADKRWELSALTEMS